MPVGDYLAKIWGGPFRKETDMGDGSHAQTVIAAPPADMVEDGRLLVDAEMTFPPGMVTGDRLNVALEEPIDINLPDKLITSGGIAGTNPRIRVDPGQSGFFAGRMFRAFLDGVIPVAGPSVQFRFTAPINFILWSQELTLTQGALQLEVYTGATESGVWPPIVPIGVNRMSERPSPFYTPVCSVATGGNFTGGTRVDVMKIRTSSANNSANNVGGSTSERGLPATVFHGRLSTLTGGLTVNDAAQYLYSILWEERP